MKQSRIVLGLFALVIAFSISSCKDDDVTPSKTEILTSKSAWKITGSTSNGVDDFSTWSDCNKDDLLKFSKDGKLTVDEGSTKCDQDDDQTVTGTWVFQEGETKLKFTFDGDDEIYTIDELNTSSMKISYSYSDNINGVSFTIKNVITLTPQ